MENVSGFLRAHIGPEFPYIYSLRPYWHDPNRIALHWVLIALLSTNTILINAYPTFFTHYNAVSLSAPLSLWTFLTASLFEPRLFLLIPSCYIIYKCIPVMQQYMGTKATFKYLFYSIILSNITIFLVLLLTLMIFKFHSIATFQSFGTLPTAAAVLIFIFAAFPNSRVSLAAGLTIVTHTDGLYTPPTLPAIMQHPRLQLLHRLLVASPPLHVFVPYVLFTALVLLLPPFSFIVPVRLTLSLACTMFISLAYLKYKFDPKQPSIITHRIKTTAKIIGKVMHKLLLKCGLWDRWEQLKAATIAGCISLKTAVIGPARASGPQYVSQSVSHGASARMLKTSEDLEDEEELAEVDRLEDDDFDDLELGEYDKSNVAEVEEGVAVHNSVGLRVGKVAKPGIPAPEFAVDWENRVSVVKLWWLFPAGVMRERAEMAITTIHEVYSETSLYEEEGDLEEAPEQQMRVDTSALERHRRDHPTDVPHTNTTFTSGAASLPVPTQPASTQPASATVAALATAARSTASVATIPAASAAAPATASATVHVPPTYAPVTAPVPAPVSAPAAPVPVAASAPVAVAASSVKIVDVNATTTSDAKEQERDVVDRRADSRAVVAEEDSELYGDSNDLSYDGGADVIKPVVPTAGPVYNASPVAMDGQLSLSDLSSREKALQMIDTRIGEIDFDEDDLDF